TDADAENSRQHKREHPAGFSHNVFKSFARRKENSNDSAERTDGSLRLRRRYGVCSHQGVLHHKFASFRLLRGTTHEHQGIFQWGDSSAAEKKLTVKRCEARSREKYAEQALSRA